MPENCDCPIYLSEDELAQVDFELSDDEFAAMYSCGKHL